MNKRKKIKEGRDRIIKEYMTEEGRNRLI